MRSSIALMFRFFSLILIRHIKQIREIMISSYWTNSSIDFTLRISILNYRGIPDSSFINYLISNLIISNILYILNYYSFNLIKMLKQINLLLRGLLLLLNLSSLISWCRRINNSICSNCLNQSSSL